MRQLWPQGRGATCDVGSSPFRDADIVGVGMSGRLSLGLAQKGGSPSPLNAGGWDPRRRRSQFIGSMYPSNHKVH